MADQVAHRRTLQELIKREDLKNKTCADCGNPNPQWASLSFAVFLCLQCAGTHRGFGVHISFVRSVSMDTWQDEQIKRMKLGGNGPFMDFMKSYSPAEQGGYKEDMSSYDKYHCWAATQYREKVHKISHGLHPPLQRATRHQEAVSAHQVDRPQPKVSANPAPPIAPTPCALAHPPSPPPPPAPIPLPSAWTKKNANETYFSSLGSVNASRPDHLPPSQGGRYQGFGNTPSPQLDSQHPSYGLSSRAAPSLAELQENPMTALSKGWSMFSSAVVGASRVVNQSIIQPGVERVTDPNFQAGVRGYVSEASRRAGEVGRSANQWSKSQFGVDVAGQVGGVVEGVKERVGVNSPSKRGYGLANQHPEEETSALYNDGDDDDFFGEYSQGVSSSHPPSSSGLGSSQQPTAPSKKADDWDEWKEF
ncbi:hypothetical protein EW146_g4228 [Bondarzewia mesenterica]|uniref:Arf-GAP domain-containing protein n=1 Tax=Bondarzewia mesenterica TaxID=1095465 RepID=A0A4S4LVR0_9AGAM|nr:hypothetical protein EW146_g4228 [Bondarzewia mesenterica]